MQPLSRRVILSHREERGRGQGSLRSGGLTAFCAGDCLQRRAGISPRASTCRAQSPPPVCPPSPVPSPPHHPCVCARVCIVNVCNPAYCDHGAPVITPSQRSLNVSLVRELCEQTRSQTFNISLLHARSLAGLFPVLSCGILESAAEDFGLLGDRTAIR